jgi:GAF domain-containing protein
MEAAALNRLSEASARLWHVQDLQEGLDQILAASLELLAADRGNIQLLDADRLRIVAHRGFDQEFLDAFREVSATHETSCGRALRFGERVVIDDVELDAGLAPYRETARAAGYRAVVSTPLAGHDGKMLGIMSAHFPSPHRPSEHELQLLDVYARQAAGFIERKRAEEALRDSERRLKLAEQGGHVGPSKPTD